MEIDLITICEPLLLIEVPLEKWTGTEMIETIVGHAQEHCWKAND